jgi:hypothetical protein
VNYPRDVRSILLLALLLAGERERSGGRAARVDDEEIGVRKAQASVYQWSADGTNCRPVNNRPNKPNPTPTIKESPVPIRYA